MPVLNRYSAALLHFSISCLIFLIFIAGLLLLWYPSPYFSASGGWQGLQLVALVDLVLGPFLTLIIYNARKSRKELFADFSIIAVVQVSALLWGINAVYEQRPVAAVFWEGSFYTVPAKSLTNQGENLERLKQFGNKMPVYVYALQPQNKAEYEAMLQEISERHIPPHEQLNRYRPLGEHYSDIRSASLNINEIIESNKAMGKRLEEILQASGTSLDDNYYIALESRYRNIVLVFSQQDQLLGMLNAPLKEGPQ